MRISDSGLLLLGIDFNRRNVLPISAGQHKRITFLKGGSTIIKILLIVVIIAAIYCISAAIACLIEAAREIEMPDIEDIEMVE